MQRERDRAGWRKKAGVREKQRNSLGGMGDRQEEQEKGKRPPQNRETEAERRKQRAGDALNGVDFLSFLPSFSPPAPSPLNLSLPLPVSAHVLLYLVCPISLTGHLSLTAVSHRHHCSHLSQTVALLELGWDEALLGGDIRYHHPPREGPETRALLLAPLLKFPSPVPLPLICSHLVPFSQQ